MKNPLLLLVVAVSIFSNTSFAVEQKLTIKAKVHWHRGGFWEASLIEYGEAGEAKLKYSAEFVKKKNDAGHFSGYKNIEQETTLSTGEVLIFEKLLKNKRFFEIQKNLSPKSVTFHQPDYDLDVCFDQNCHQVRLYELSRLPDHMEADAESFKAVWNFLWNFAEGEDFKSPNLTL